MACCVGAKYDNWCDGVEIVWTDPETKKEYCLFHAPEDRKGMKNGTYLQLHTETLINNQILKNGSHLKLDGAIFTVPVYLKDKNFNSLSLTHTIFKEGLTFDGITFDFPIRCDFITCNESLCFFDCEINEFPIAHCRLSGGLQCRNCNWNTEVFIPPSTTSISLVNSSFYQPVTYSISQLSHNIELRGLGLYSDFNIVSFSHFSKAIINTSCAVSVKKSSPNSVLQFNNIDFACIPKFQGLSCEFNFHFNCCSFHTLFIEPTLHSAKINFIGCNFDAILLNRSLLHTPTFKACNFPKHKNKNILVTTKKALPTTNMTMPDEFSEQEHIYRQLKKQAQDEENRLLASDWHYWEKYFYEKRIFTEGTALEWLILRWYRRLSDYGENVGKAMSWLLIFILASIFFGFLAPNPPTDTNSTISPIANAALQYIPLGTSTPKESSWLRFFQVFWQLLITLQATLLGFALRNRYRR